jgi:hypothetical protein
MMKYIFVALCLVAIVVATETEVVKKNEDGIAKRQLDLGGLVGCVVALVANIVGGLLRVIIGLVITLSGGTEFGRRGEGEKKKKKKLIVLCSSPNYNWYRRHPRPNCCWPRPSGC